MGMEQQFGKEVRSRGSKTQMASVHNYRAHLNPSSVCRNRPQLLPWGPPLR